MAGRKKNQTYDQAVFGMKKLTGLLLYILVVVFIIFVGRTAYVYGYQLFNETAPDKEPGREVTVEIPEGASTRAIADILEDNGLIKSKTLFLVQERLSSYHGDLGSGTFRLSTAQKPTEIIAILSGESPDPEEGAGDAG